jgi:hypothetical protein
MLIKSKHEGYSRDGVRRVFLDGGGGGGSSKSTQYSTNIPEYAKQPFMDLVGKSEALSQQEYQPYTQQRIEGFTPLQQQAQQQAGNQQTAGQIGAGSGLAAVAGMQGLNAGNYQPQQVGTQSFLQGQNAQSYMSPYMQQVVDIQKREAMRDADIAGTQRNAQAAKAGAFGGSRQAIMDAEAQRNLGMQLGDIQSRGLQSAYDQARSQFNTEQGLGLQAQQANQGAGLDAQKLGLSGLGVAMQGAQTLGQLGQQQFGQQMDITQLQSTMGQQQQQLGQKQLDQQYADFQAQRDYPYQQLGFLADILRGTSGSTRTMYSSQPSAGGLQNLAGLGSLAAGFGMYRGGRVGYASGGIVEPLALPARLRTLSDQQLQQFSQQNKEDLFSMALAKSEMDARARMRQAGAPAGAAPQGTVMDEVAAEMDPMTQQGLAAAAPDMDFADGGIVGYADGGPLEQQRMSDREGVAQFGRAVWEQMKRAGAAIADVGTMPVRGVAGAYDTAVIRPLRAAGLNAAYLSPNLVPEGADVDSMTPFYDMFRRKDAGGEAKPYGIGNEGRRTPNYTPGPKGLEAALAPAPAPSDKGFKETPDKVSVSASGKTTSSVAGTPRAGLAAAPAFDIEAQVAPIEKQQAELDAKNKASAEADLSDYDKLVASQGKAKEAQEARIKEQQAGLEGGEKKAQKMALIQAGLAILTADPARGGLAAIGEGALKGFGAYKGDIEKLEGKREQLLDKLDGIDELRRQEALATGKERMALLGKIRTAEADAVRNQIAIAKELRIPLTAEAAKQSLQERLKLMEIAAAERNSIRQASATRGAGRSNNQLEIIQALSQDPTLMRTYQNMQTKGGPDMMGAFNDYLKANPMAASDPRQALQDFLAAQSALGSLRNVGVTSAPGAVDRPR